jgi:hypothetical protein
MTYFKAASVLALMMTLAGCAGSASNSSAPVPPAGDTLASACPEVMELMKQGADGMEKADKEKKFSDPDYLDALASIVNRLDKIEVGIKADDEAVLVQNLANAFAKILEEQSDDKAISQGTGKLAATAVQELSSACIDLVQRNN